MRGNFFTLPQALILLVLVQHAWPKITIWKPSSLQNYFHDNELKYNISSFGKVPYGHSLIGRVFLANPLNACSEIKLPPHDFNKDGSIILITMRGDCPFAKKAFNAQRAGASLLMYVDNAIEDVTKVLPFKEPTFSDQIKIPSILLDKIGGGAIIENLIANQIESSSKNNLIIAIDFPIGQQTNSKVNWLMSINSWESYHTLKDIYESFTEIRKNVEFNPVYFTYR
jgi:hypothetical protein